MREDCSKADCSRCLYVTNDRLPFGRNNNDDHFEADSLFYFDELSTKAQAYIVKRCNELGVDSGALTAKLGVYVLNYRGKDSRTRTETVRKIIDDFLAKLNVSARINAEKLRGVWELLLQGNAENPDPFVRLTKEQLAWPIVVQACCLSRDDSDFDDCDDDIREAVCEAYGSLIDDASERFELVAKIEFDFAEFRHAEGSKNIATDRKKFIDVHYGDYLGEIGAEGLGEEVAEILTKQVVRKVLFRQRMIEQVREGMNLAH